MISTKERRLKKVLLLALEGSTDGERLTALNMAKNLLQQWGKDSHWLMARIVTNLDAPDMSRYQHWSQRQEPMPTERWETMFEYLSREPVMQRMRQREQEFINSLAYQHRRRGEGWIPTIKQTRWMAGIYTRMKVTDV